MLGQHMGYDMNHLPEYNDITMNTILKKSGIDITIEKLKEKPYMKEGMEVAFKDRKFNTPSGRIELYCEAITEKWNECPIPDFYAEGETSKDGKCPLRFLSTHARERIHSQFADIKSINDRKGILYINSKDAADRNITDGDMVKIFNDRGIISAYVKITNDIKPGAVNVFEGLSEHTGASVNMLTEQGATDIGFSPIYYDCYVEVKLFNETR